MTRRRLHWRGGRRWVWHLVLRQGLKRDEHDVGVAEEHPVGVARLAVRAHVDPDLWIDWLVRAHVDPGLLID